ncbi:MAG: RlmE family RNA methyltransferase [archaeon]
MSSRWKQERRRDQFYRLAKRRGYRSRATFKLRQAIEKYHFIQRGNKVLDLGASPGGWIQAARQIVGTQGYVLGIDIELIPAFNFENVDTLQFDIMDDGVFDRIREKIPLPVDVVISDISPNISGAWDVDHGRQIQLAERSLEIAERFLHPGGSFFVKVFHGRELERFRDRIADSFERVRQVKPPASRPRSSEIYLLALGFKGRI